MDFSFLITPHVKATLRALSPSDRTAITQALASELFLGVDLSDRLTPIQVVILGMVRSYIEHDTEQMIV